MYITLFFIVLTLFFGITGFVGLGYGPIPLVQVFFYIFIGVTIFTFLMERGKKRKNKGF